jgi:hypothetical protein
MRTHFANVLLGRSYPALSVGGAWPMVCALDSATVPSPYLSLVRWQRRKAESRCVSRIAFPYEVQEESQP